MRDKEVTMRLPISIIALIVGVSLSPSIVAEDVPPLAPRLRQELLRMMQDDQQARFRMLAVMQRKGAAPDELPDVKEVRRLDRYHTARLKQIIDCYGWPGKSLVGSDGAHAAWLLVQHADHDRRFQKKCLDLLRQAVQENEAAGEQLAYLTDRLLVAEKKRQRYGTQLRVVDGQLVPYPIENEAEVDQRRKRVGLPPLQEYLIFARKMYKGKR